MSEYARSMGTTKMELMRSLQVGAIANARAFANAHIVEVRASRRPAGCGVGALEMARLPFINDWGRGLPLRQTERSWGPSSWHLGRNAMLSHSCLRSDIG